MNGEERFCNTTGQLRWNNGVLEYEKYANFSEDGRILEYPDMRWFPVPVKK